MRCGVEPLLEREQRYVLDSSQEPKKRPGLGPLLVLERRRGFGPFKKRETRHELGLRRISSGGSTRKWLSQREAPKPR